MRLFVLLALPFSGCFYKAVDLEPYSERLPADAPKGPRVEAQMCNHYLFGFLPISYQEVDVQDLLDQTGPVHRLSVAEKNIYWVIGFTSCLRVSGLSATK